jgi:hypothetical protein
VDMSESNEDQTFPAVYDDPTQWLPKEVLEANDESSTIAFTRFGERVPTANMSAPGQGGGAFTDFMGDSSAIENSYNPFGFSTALMEQQTAQTNISSGYLQDSSIHSMFNSSSPSAAAFSTGPSPGGLTNFPATFQPYPSAASMKTTSPPAIHSSGGRISQDDEQLLRKGPSGPRRAGQGVEEEEQQVASIEVMQNGGLKLRVTLLAAGFVIGSSGASIREIMRHTGSSIQSWTQHPEAGGYHRPCRVFCIQGSAESVVAASNIIHEAVERYKELCEGKRRGEFVQRLQYIRGVEFSYQPPPKNVMPNAASVNGQPTNLRNAAILQPSASVSETMKMLAAAQAQRAAMQHYQTLAASSYAAGLAAGAKMGQLHSMNDNSQGSYPAPGDFFSTFSPHVHKQS